MDLAVLGVFVFGLLLGGLLNVIIIRMPREKNLLGAPRCTRCGAPLAAWQLIPLVGWLAQGGRGRCCQRPLNLLFPIIELGTALILTIFYLRFGFSSTFAYLVFISCVLIITGAIDWLHRYIYTMLILIPALLAIAVSVFIPGLGWLNSLVGALVSGFVFALMFLLARFLFPSAAAPFGLGDVYLGIFIGAAVGVTNLAPALFYGMLMAGIFAAILIVLRRMGRPNVPAYISYGAFLCLGALVFLLLFGVTGFV